MKGRIYPYDRSFTVEADPKWYGTRYNIYDDEGNRIAWCYKHELVFE